MSMFEPRVTLDQASFRALASETRIAILKALSEHQMTLTDLAERLQISKPGVMKHLELLQEAGLVLREDAERKWIYYRLTTKGERILDPERTRIALALGLSAVVTAVGLAATALFASHPSSANPPGIGAAIDVVGVLPLVVVAIGALATLVSFISWRRRPTASDAEILARLGSLPEETPGAAPPAGSPPS
jgi:DNA-binding transcriptional ArsR family regulator